MSYILDALKKSEQARGSRKTRALLDESFDMPVSASHCPGNSRRWLYFFAVILILNSGFIVFWLHNTRHSASPAGTNEQLRTGKAADAEVKADSTQSTEHDAHGSESRAAAEDGFAGSAAQQKPSVIPPQQAAVQLSEGNEKETYSAEEEQSATNTPIAVENPEISTKSSPTEIQDREAAQVIEKTSPKNAKPAAENQKSEQSTHSDQGNVSPRRAVSSPPKEIEAEVKKTDAAKTHRNQDAEMKANSRASNLRTALKSHPAETAHPAAESGIISDIEPLAEVGASTDKSATAGELKLRDLTPQIRDAIPNISVSMLIYSKNPENRWININGSKRREGDEIDAGLKLEEITPEGAVFSYRGHRFYKGVLGD